MQAGAQQADNTLTINFNDLMGQLSPFAQQKQGEVFGPHLETTILRDEDLQQIFAPLRDATAESYIQALHNINAFMGSLYAQQDIIQAQLHENKIQSGRLAHEISTEEKALAKAEAEYARLLNDSAIKRQQKVNAQKSSARLVGLRKDAAQLDAKFRQLQTEVIDTELLSQYEQKIRNKFIHELSEQMTEKETKRILRQYFNEYLAQDINYVGESDLDRFDLPADDAVASSLFADLNAAFVRTQEAQAYATKVQDSNKVLSPKAILQYMHIMEGYKFAVNRLNAHLQGEAKAGHSARELGFDFAGAPELGGLDIFELQTKDVREDHHEYVCLDTDALGKMDRATVDRFEALFQDPAIVRGKGSNGFKLTKPDQFNKANKGEETVPVCKLVATGMGSYRIFPTHKLEKGDGAILWVFGEARATKGGASKGDYDNDVTVIRAPGMAVRT